MLIYSNYYKIFKAKLISGYGIASGKSNSSPYPEGSIKMQAPFFKTLGLDISKFWPGTLNLLLEDKRIIRRSIDYSYILNWLLVYVKFTIRRSIDYS